MRTRQWIAAGLVALAGGLSGTAFATTTINKQFTPATVNPGDVSRFRISIFNSSLVPLTAAAVTDNLPAQIAIANPPNVADTCAFATVVAAAGTQDVRVSGGTVPAGSGTLDGSCYIELDVVSTTAGNWANTIPANGPANGFVPDGAIAGYQAVEGAATVTNATAATATLSVRSLSRPTGTKTFSPSTGLVGEPLTLTIVLANPNTAATIPLTSFVDNLPAGMVVAPVPSPTVSCNGSGAVAGALTATPGASSITLTGGVLGISGNCTLAAKVVVDTLTGPVQSFANVVPANAIGNTRGLASNSFNRSVTVNTPIGLAKAFVGSVGGSVVPNPTRVGQEFWARIDISNLSTVTPLTLTSLTDTLPAGLVVGSGTPVMDCVSSGGGVDGTIAATPGDGSFTITGGTVGITGGTRRCRIHVPVVAAAAGAYTNTLPANAVGNSAGHPSPIASTFVNVNAELRLQKTASSSSAAPGQPVTFTLTISNYSAGPVSGVTLTDNLPLVSGGQMVISNPNGFSPGSGCSGGTWGSTPGSASLTWTGGTIVGGVGLNPGVCTISFKANAPVTATIGQVFSNAIATGAITGTGVSGGVSNGNSASVNVAMVAAASVTKAFSPTSIVQGGTSLLTVTLSNQTAVALTNASLTDTFPVGVSVAAAPSTSSTCTGAVVSATPGAGSASVSGATVPANGSCYFRVSVTASTVGAKTNTVAAGALANDQGATNPAAANATLTVTSGLTATKGFSPSSVANGGVSRATIRVTNPSGTPFTDLSVTDGPMTNLAVANPAQASTTCAGSPVITATPGSSTVTMTGATLAAGGNCDLLFNVVTSGNPANWPNTLPPNAITTAEGAYNTGNVTATLGKLTTVNIGINKSFNPVSVSAGQPSQLQIDITNPISSPATVTGLGFSDSFPSGMEVYPNPDVSTTCTNGIVSAVPGAASVSMSGATLAPGATCSVFVKVTSTKFLNLTNTIPVGNVTTTEGLTNSAATTATLSTLQGVGVAKSFGPVNVAPGQPTTLTLTLISTLDPGAPVPVTLHDVSFTDTLPAGVVVAPVPNATSDCSGATVTASAGSPTVTLTGVSLAPDTICVTEVDVVAGSLGTYTNVIPKFTVTTTEGYVNQSDSSATFNVLNAPVISKAFAPATVAPGATSTLTVTLVNSNPVPLTNALILDTLPALLSVAPVPNASTTCGAGSVAATPAGATVQLTNGTIPANGSCVMTVDVRSNTPNAYVNTIEAGALSTAEGVTNTSPGSATLNVIGPPAVTKAFAPASTTTGQVSVLTLSLGNPNPANATLTSALVDTLPANLVLASPPNLSGTCTLGSVVLGANSVTYSAGATIAPGGCTLSVDVTSAVPGTYTNTIAAGALVTDAGSNGTAASAAVVFDAPPPTDLAITKTNGVSTLATGGTTQYVVTVSNAGPGAADGAVVTDPAVAGLVKTGVACVAAGGAVCPAAPALAALEAGGLVMGSFPSGSSATFTVDVNVTAGLGATVTNVAAVAVPPAMTDSNPMNNSASDSDFVLSGADLAITKTHAGNFTRGQVGASFTLSVANHGDMATVGTVSVTDTLPAGLTATALSGTGWTCTLVPLACSRADALADSAAYPDILLTVDVADGAAQDLVNTASVSGGADVNPANNTANDPVVVLGTPDLTIAKTHAGAFAPGQSGATYTLVVANLGPTASNGEVSVTDTLPAGLTATAIAGPGWACTLSPLRCARSDALGPGTDYPAITLTVDVAWSASGSIVNSASVSGGGDVNTTNNSATDIASVSLPPDLVVQKTHAGTLAAGQPVSYSIVVRNDGATATAGVVSVTDALPSMLSATAMSGAGWSCVLATLTCTRADALAPGASYPPIVLDALVRPGATGAIVNVATVAGGADAVGDNNSASDSDLVQIGSEPTRVPTLSQWGLMLLAFALMMAGGRQARRRG